eukprot:2769162-Rhodomonas_salina.7
MSGTYRATRCPGNRNWPRAYRELAHEPENAPEGDQTLQGGVCAPQPEIKPHRIRNQALKSENQGPNSENQRHATSRPSTACGSAYATCQYRAQHCIAGQMHHPKSTTMKRIAGTDRTLYLRGLCFLAFDFGGKTRGRVSTGDVDDGEHEYGCWQPRPPSQSPR